MKVSPIDEKLATKIVEIKIVESLILTEWRPDLDKTEEKSRKLLRQKLNK